jgi:hypothetical protein
MKTRSLFLLVPVAAVAIAWLSWGPRNSGGNADPAGPYETPSPAATEIARQTAQEPTAVRNPAPVADATTGQGCDLVTYYVPVGDGTVQEAFACVPPDPAEQHAYESYSSAALESLAYADAKAAEVLGMRRRERDEARAVSLFLRSSALSGGDITPILRYSQSYPEPSAINGVPVRKTIQTKYVLSAVADLLSTDTQYAVPWENEIRRYSTDADQEIAMLQARARRIVAEMRQIELDVTGSSSLGGQGDA